MNAFLQIIVISTNQSVAEIPRIFLERIVIDTKTECFHIFNHKDGGGSCVSLTEGMNLPNIRSEFRQMLYSFIYSQALIRKLFFGCKVS